MTAPNAARQRHSNGGGTLLFGALCYVLFIVYGSLVPLDFKPRPWELVWQDFLNIPYLTLGIESRADWVANGVLYAPLGALLTAGIGVSHRPVIVRLLLGAVVFVLCACLALGVEFVQLFFPPRTVSMNDIIAEFVGSAIGIVACNAWGRKLGQLRAELSYGGTLAIRAAAITYLIAYLLLSLFPYDFFISAEEFSHKLASDAYGWLLAPAMCDRMSVCAVKLIAEAFVVVPLGILLSMTLGNQLRYPHATAIWCGLALGLVMELTQLFMASGISQGLSLVTRIVGMRLGMALHRRANNRWFTATQPYLIPAAAVLSLPYVFALMWLSGWFSATWGGFDQAITSLYNLNWMPFYYHYYTTEQGALRSLLVNAAMYLPIGLVYWAWTIRHSLIYSHGTAIVPALLAVPLATTMEAGKLFVHGKRADPTDVLIAAAAAAIAYLLAKQLQRWAFQSLVAPRPETRAEPLPRVDTALSAAPSAGRQFMAALILCAVVAAAVIHPLGTISVLVMIGLYAAFIWRYPQASLPAIVGLLPLLNFAPWTGWILLNEFDLFAAVTLALRLIRQPPDVTHLTLSHGAKWALSLLALSYSASTVIGLLPWVPFDQNTLFSYFGSLDSLRVLKGFAWAVALMPLLLEVDKQEQGPAQPVALGMLAGLGSVVAVVAWERLAFASAMDFSSDFRVEGPFPELHTGGGDINAYLVMAIPFVAWWATQRPTVLRILFGFVLFVFASYAVAVTFTRGGYVGYCAVILVLAIAAMRHWWQKGASPLVNTMAVIVMAFGGAAVIAAIGSGTFMEGRLATTKVDAGTRTKHWARAIEMMDGDVTTTLFGMGLGSFPRTLLAKDREAASATFGYQKELGNAFLRLGSGRALYLAQYVTVKPGKRYTLGIDVRSRAPGAQLSVALCEKSVQSSFSCETATVSEERGGKWVQKQIVFNTEQLGSRKGLLPRPIALSLSNTQRNGVIEVDNISLMDEGGRNLLTNGDFSQDGAHWFFATDDHLPWHIFNLWVQILFEQGALGILAFVILAAAALLNLTRRMWRGDWFSGSVLAALSGFLSLGLTESLFDGPRVTTLFFLLLLLGLRPTAHSSLRQSNAPLRQAPSPATRPHRRRPSSGLPKS